MEFLPEHWDIILHYLLGDRLNIEDHMVVMIRTHRQELSRLKRIQPTAEHPSYPEEEWFPRDMDTRQVPTQTTLLEMDYTCHRILLKYALYIHFGYTENASHTMDCVLEEWSVFVEHNLHALKHFDSPNDCSPWIEEADLTRYNELMKRVKWHQDTKNTWNAIVHYKNKQYKWMRQIPKPIHYSEGSCNYNECI